MKTRGDRIRGYSNELLARQLVNEQIAAAVIVLENLDKDMAKEFLDDAEKHREEMEKEKLDWLMEVVEE